MKALVTGGRRDGSAICALLDDPLVLDLPEFDISDVGRLGYDGEYDAAFLNAGRDRLPSCGRVDGRRVAPRRPRQPRRLVYGTRELAARPMPGGGSIVATASLAGLTAMPFDPPRTPRRRTPFVEARYARPRPRGSQERGIR